MFYKNIVIESENSPDIVLNQIRNVVDERNFSTGIFTNFNTTGKLFQGKFENNTFKMYLILRIHNFMNPLISGSIKHEGRTKIYVTFNIPILYKIVCTIFTFLFILSAALVIIDCNRNYSITSLMLSLLLVLLSLIPFFWMWLQINCTAKKVENIIKNLVSI